MNKSLKTLDHGREIVDDFLPGPHLYLKIVMLFALYVFWY